MESTAPVDGDSSGVGDEKRSAETLPRGPDGYENWIATVEGFINAVDRVGWASDEYKTWLGDLAETQILKPKS